MEIYNQNILDDEVPEENKITQATIDKLKRPHFHLISNSEVIDYIYSYCMNSCMIEPPKIDKPLTYSYSVSDKSKKRYERKKKRAEEIGLRLFILDEDDKPNELKDLEQFIIDNYINLDLDVPTELKQKYRELKQKYQTDK